MTALANVKAKVRTPLEVILREKIARDGPLNIAEYMDIALGHPQHGYYMTRDPFGVSGDFTTSPEISQMFGEIIGAYFADWWRQNGAPKPFHLIEYGPGRGTLMADALRIFARLPGLMDALRIHLVEVSPVLRREQEKNLASYGQKITWHDGLEHVPQGAFALVSNEFLDALPIRQFQRLQGQWYERLVGLKREQLAFVLRPAELETDAPENAVLEISPARENFIDAVGARLQKDLGIALFIDYGFTEPAFADTFQAVHDHAYADPLSFPGECDLTSHVDFSALRARALKTGCDVYGPISQAEFLLTNGIKERAEQLQRANPSADIQAALCRLTAPEEMGELFKVLALASSKNLPHSFMHV